MVSGVPARLLPEPENYAKNFYELFKTVIEAQRVKTDWKKCKKNKANRKKDKKKVEIASDVSLTSIPEIEVTSNASAFAVFSNVRSAVLERHLRNTSEIYRSSNCSSPPLDSDPIDTDSEDEDKTCTVQNLPKIIGIGLRSVFSLIKESKSIDSTLCTKALKALLDVLQGQLPEDLKLEPDDVLDPLFDLLLDFATSHGPESAGTNDGNHLTAVACACLLSMVVVRGDTGRILAAVTALLMCPRALAMQNVQMPCVLTTLQRSVQAVLLGKLRRPDWITHGVTKSSKVFSSVLKLPNELSDFTLNGRSFVSNGRYLYVHTNRGLLKIGSGYDRTTFGHIYAYKADFYPTETGWLGYANGSLYFKCAPKKKCELLILDAETLTVRGIAVLEGRDWMSSVMFSDGESLGMITAGKYEDFVVRTINTLSNPVTVTSELPLKLARKCVDIFGSAAFDEDQSVHVLNLNSDDEIMMVAAGKEFGLLSTVSGKLYYTGKGSCIGMKTNTRPNRWLEVTLGKNSRVTHLAIGHEGQHTILLLEDGSVYFAGVAKRGENAESVKARRQSNPTKPKKMIKVDPLTIIDAACNNGTTALVTKDGSLLMYGKDYLYSNEVTGLVADLKEVFVERVSLGKAHAAVVSNKGHLYTFGINNKGQCGRDFMTCAGATTTTVTATQPTNKETTTIIAMETGAVEDELIVTEEVDDAEQADEQWDEGKAMCPSGQHKWKRRLCMVCTICRECTGYSVQCSRRDKPHRYPGQECGCGLGESGCAMCGCCRMCAGEKCDNGGEDILCPSGAGNLSGEPMEGLLCLETFIEERSGNKFRDFIRRRLESKRQRQRMKSSSGASKHALKIKDVLKSPNNAKIVGGPSASYQRVSEGKGLNLVAASGFEESVGGSDIERGEAARIASIPPARVPIPSDSPVVQVSCGLHHTVILLQNGEVYSFGSNTHGQLGVGDLAVHSGPVQVKLNGIATRVAAGSNHTVILTFLGEVYTFGAYQKGQLGVVDWSSNQSEARNNSETGRCDDKSSAWYSHPNLVPNIGPKYGRRATWIGASGDQTYVKVDEINSISLTRSTVMANKTCIMLISNQDDHMNSFKCLVINKRDGSCSSYSGNDQVDFTQCAACLDPLYNVIWSLNSVNNQICAYNVICSEVKNLRGSEPWLLSPALAIPVISTCFVTRSQAAMYLLACLDTLTQAEDHKLTIIEENDCNQSVQGKIYSREDFSIVTRFESFGGGWGYSDYSIEAIRFMADTDILLGGYGLFGGRGEYNAKIKLYDIGVDGGDLEHDGELLAETDVIPYECGSRQKYSILFEEPVSLQANRWYVAWSRITGPSSDCGSGGQATVTSEDQVVFYFKTSKRANNGTGVNAGQIPQLLYRIITPENSNLNHQRDQTEHIYILKREFSRTVTKDCFQSLISLLQWSWNTLKASLLDVSTPHTISNNVIEMERLVYISKASLNLLRTYTSEIYPDQVLGKKPISETVRLAECIGDVRSLLRQILSDGVSIGSKSKGKARIGKCSSSLNQKFVRTVLDECHKTFVSCYHAFYPTAYLKWTLLCELLSDIDKEQGTSSKDRLLSAVLAALCNSSIRLKNTFPILNNVMDGSDDSLKKQLSPSRSHNYPILVEQMSYKSQVECAGKEPLNWSFRQVLDKLLDLILTPVKKSLCKEKSQSLAELVLHCCYLLARVIAELAAQSSGTEDEFQAACGRRLYMTPSRFTRIHQARSWNTGNGSPDAICFTVDRPGIVIAGVGIYGGAGLYEYELELLDDKNNAGCDPSHTQRWSSLDFSRGTFGEDGAGDIVELKFDKPVPIKENVKYAIRLRNRGGRTNNGDGGLNSVKGPDGTTFTFATCSLSYNGTTQTRGQIPHVLYYSHPPESEGENANKAIPETQARKCTLAMTTTIMQRANEIFALAREKSYEVMATSDVFGNATFVTTLLPLLMAYITPLATFDPKSGVQVLSLIQEMLPHVTALNLLSSMEASQASQESEGQSHFPSPFTTSHNYTWLESDHPYKVASVSHYKVSFPETVKWLTVEFTPECGTAQPEDYLQLYIPTNNPLLGTLANVSLDENPTLLPVLPKLSNVPSQWPQNAVVLPGNEVIFSLETASDYMKDERSNTYGFKCLVIGYDWITTGNGLKNLEMELTFLGGACAASLMKKNLTLPPASKEEVEDDLEVAQETTKRIFSAHSSLLGRGFALASTPTVSQALDGIFPFSCHSNERLFLRDFVCCLAGTSGGRLARWLQPDSFVDCAKCEAVYLKDEMKCGKPGIITIVTRDQYEEIVYVPDLKVDVKAIPIDKKYITDDQGRKIRRISQHDPLTFGGHPRPPVDVPYEVTVDDKSSFYAITAMKAYQNYSFEELRFTSPVVVKRSSESMLVRPNADGTYSATWTPASTGWYSLIITIDGYCMEENYEVEVKLPPGMPSPAQNIVRRQQHQPSKMRKFIGKNSSGLRIRTHPSLQSEQIGIVGVNEIIVFVQQIHNDDGVWLRLDSNTIRLYCNNQHKEAWCLQYHQHLGKTLLTPIDPLLKEVSHKGEDKKEARRMVFTNGKGTNSTDGKYMVVVACGASGHNIRSKPNLKAPPVGMLALGNDVTIKEFLVNSEGVWVRLEEESANKYCFGSTTQAWSLAINKQGVMYMKTDSDFEINSPENKGYDFSMPSASHEGFNFTTHNFSSAISAHVDTANSSVPFIFGTHTRNDSTGSMKSMSEKNETSKIAKQTKEKLVKEKDFSDKGSKFSALQKWLRGDDKNCSDKRNSGRDFTELVGVSVKELVKSIGESRTNGNGTPPDTPKKMSRSSSPKNPQDGSSRYNSRSSSPVAIPAGSHRPPGGSGICLFPPAPNTTVSGCMAESANSHRRGSTQSDTSALVSSLTRDLSQSPNSIESCSSLHMRSEGSTSSLPNTPKKERRDSQDSPRKVSQAQTQTSPDNANNTMKGHFSIGSSGAKDERQSPKLNRREYYMKVAKTRTKRAMSPANGHQSANPSRSLHLTKDKVKEALSPSLAESLRAVFAAFLWHEGIVHDAMACASFLKFQPNLSKQGALVVTRQHSETNGDKQKRELTKEQRARQRHSLEVTNAGHYLHMQPSTLETLTRSAANANANRNRKKPETNVKEDSAQSPSKLSALPEFNTVTILPPALKCLVLLWEELSAQTLRFIELQLNFSNLDAIGSNGSKLSKRVSNEKSMRDDKIKEREKKGNRKKKEVKFAGGANSSESVDHESVCELCGMMFPHPVTYHMKLAHPGCGYHAGGKGYNSRGNYCMGWAGYCGDGGLGVGHWYLICDVCREKYIRENIKRKKLGKKLAITGLSRRKTDTSKNSSPTDSPAAADIHIMVKNNAMFLLDLASAAGSNILKQQRRPSQTLSSVAENSSPPEAAGPFPPTGPFQCLQALGIHHTLDNDDRYYAETLRRQSGQSSVEASAAGFNSVTRPLSEYHVGDNESESAKNRGMFHRSVSMSTGAPWTKNGNDGRVVMMRKRNNSSSELAADGGSSLLCYPSAALQKLVPSLDQSAIVSSNQSEMIDNEIVEILLRPVTIFVFQQHNLQHLQLAMKHALRRAACRVYAMQAFNWLLRTVTQPMCLHDLLWWFVSSLTPIVAEPAAVTDDNNRPEKKEDHDMFGISEHPLSDLVIAGEAANPLPTAFHTLLQTIADLMLLPPLGSPLQQAAVRCWNIKFTTTDHAFLHRSHVFSNISKILSRSEEEDDISMSMHESHQSNYSQQTTSFIELLKDVTHLVDIKASSRQAMVGSLIDGSTETFWESGDDDRNKTKTFFIICGPHTFPRVIYIHIDNCRDLNHKVSSIAFQSGPNLDELFKLKSVEIESRSAGWINCPMLDSKHTAVSLELKGPDNSLRVRQIRILGEIEGEALKVGKALSAMMIQQKNCEAETLKVFRSITSQVFGKLIQREQQSCQQSTDSTDNSNEEVEDSNDLREHMVGILFSRSTLTHLQKQVCAHIVQAIRKEAQRIREEWEILLCSPTPANSFLSDSSDSPKSSDTYCFEMLSMVLALSGSRVGRSYVSHQSGLLKDLLSLLHTGSARVQRQVTALLRRILPEVSPQTLAEVEDVERLPPSDYSIVSMTVSDQPFDEHAPAVLDVFLSCIAKALSVQVKIKDKETGKAIQTTSLATSIHPKSFVGSRWWLRGCITRKLAQVIIQLLKDMAAGKLSEVWATVTKSAIAENILNLTKLEEKNRDPIECLRTPTLWLALASLCVLDSDHVERLSSGQWNTTDGQAMPPRPTCSNHDDGETTAIIQCNFCDNLCAECDRILHLNRKTRLHIRQVCKEEEEAIRVDLHEGCGRTKLFWVLALADSHTLKALVEFRDGSPRKPVGIISGVCRFCGTTGNTGLLAIGNICADHECQEHAKNACSKVHQCGHLCSGVRNEETCLPCLHRCSADSELKQDADDMCMICFTEALSCAPAIQLQCGHVFHLHCCKNVLQKRWVGPRITFGFSQCPICKMPMDHPNLAEDLDNIKGLFDDVKRKALMRLEYEGLHIAEAVMTPGRRYYQEPVAYAMDRYAYYVCYKCKKAYYGGEARCDAQQGGETFDPTELVCGGCSDVAGAQMCPRHGTDFLEYKCRYCCSVAVFFCFGTTHFCNSCHDDFQRVTSIPKHCLPSCPAGPKAKQLEGDECPLHVKHPPTGEEFALGCGICRNAHTF